MDEERRREAAEGRPPAGDDDAADGRGRDGAQPETTGAEEAAPPPRADAEPAPPANEATIDHPPRPPGRRPAGPPLDWLERVRRHAPGLLIPGPSTRAVPPTAAAPQGRAEPEQPVAPAPSTGAAKATRPHQFDAELGESAAREAEPAAPTDLFAVADERLPASSSDEAGSASAAAPQPAAAAEEAVAADELPVPRAAREGDVRFDAPLVAQRSMDHQPDIAPVAASRPARSPLGGRDPARARPALPWPALEPEVLAPPRARSAALSDMDPPASELRHEAAQIRVPAWPAPSSASVGASVTIPTSAPPPARRVAATPAPALTPAAAAGRIAAEWPPSDDVAGSPWPSLPPEPPTDQAAQTQAAMRAHDRWARLLREQESA